ncbi:MAG: cysteine methyltransferase, partial [Chromatiales bacterium]|nr:cysteine methyltransferase [Chromatiales bacterium]
MTTEAAPGHETGIASQAVATPVGTLGIVATNDAVVRVMWASTNEQRHKEEKALWDGDNSLLAEAVRQIQAYFAGKLNTFDLPLAPAGTEFQQQVYRQMSAIAYGQTRSYGALAA